MSQNEGTKGIFAFFGWGSSSSSICARTKQPQGAGADPPMEKGLLVGASVIGKLKNSWIGGSPYLYGTVDRLDPLQISDADGKSYLGNMLQWVVAAQDDGWLAPFGLEWQQPGRYVLLQLLQGDWISARVAKDHKVQDVQAGPLHLRLDGIESLPSVCIQTEVAYLFTPHEKCQEEFGHAYSYRGGRLAEHIERAFENAKPSPDETLEDALRRQRRRWVEESRVDGQYPVRSTWVHPTIKQGALNEFARRAQKKKQESPVPIHPEIVMLLGPPAAGKSSISRLSPDQLSGSMKPLRRTAASLKYREEVNNDNLTDCMPGFPDEYKYALSVDDAKSRSPKALWKKARAAAKVKLGCVAHRLEWIRDMHRDAMSAEAWACQWLTYLVYHHGPVRDSLALDIIKVTIIDAHELPVYYSSCMAGKAMARTMLILDLCHSESRPVPHKPLAFRGFWPFTSQESRYDRQAGRAEDEKKEKKLKGGNLTSNLVDIHYHAQQAELNITKMLGCLSQGVKPTDEEGNNDEETDVLVDHFLVIDNEGSEPQVLLDFADAEGQVTTDIRESLLGSVIEVETLLKLLDKEALSGFDVHIFRVFKFFLGRCAPKDHPLRNRAKEMKHRIGAESIKDPVDVLPIVTEIDEHIFFRKYGSQSTATHTNAYREMSHLQAGDRTSFRETLASIPDDDIDALKKAMSVMRKYTCLAIMQYLKKEGDWQDELVDMEKNVAECSS